MSLATFFAFSWEIPSSIDAKILYSLPESWGSPASRAFSEMPRLISLDWKTSRTAFTRSSELASMRIFSPDQEIEAPTPLKS